MGHKSPIPGFDDKKFGLGKSSPVRTFSDYHKVSLTVTLMSVLVTYLFQVTFGEEGGRIILHKLYKVYAH